MARWSIGPFEQLHDAIEEVFENPQLVDITTLTRLQYMFDAIKDDFSQLLKVAPKSSAHRDEIRKGSLYVYY